MAKRFAQPVRFSGPNTKLHSVSQIAQDGAIALQITPYKKCSWPLL